MAGPAAIAAARQAVELATRQIVVVTNTGDRRALSSVLQNVFDAWMNHLGQPLPPISKYGGVNDGQKRMIFSGHAVHNGSNERAPQAAPFHALPACRSASVNLPEICPIEILFTESPAADFFPHPLLKPGSAFLFPGRQVLSEA